MKLRPLTLALVLAVLAGCGGRSNDLSLEQATKAAQAGPDTTTAGAASAPAPKPPPQVGGGLTPFANDDLRRMTIEQRQKEAAKAEQDGNVARAEACYVMNVEELRSGDHKTWQYPNAIRSLAFFYHYKNQVEKAEATFRDFVEAQKEVAGPEHAYVAGALLDFAGWLNYHQRFVETLPMYDQSIAIFEKTNGPNSPEVARAMQSKIGALRNSDRPGELQATEERLRQITTQPSPTPSAPTPEPVATTPAPPAETPVPASATPAPVEPTAAP